MMDRRERSNQLIRAVNAAKMNQLIIHDEQRTMSMTAVAPRGAGKSRLYGKILAYQDFVRGVPLILWDPTGSLTAYFIDSIARQPADIQEKMWRRVRYVDVAGRDGRILPFPFLSPGGPFSLYDRSQRFVDLVRRIDGKLADAPMLGLNSLAQISTHLGIVLGALDLELTEAQTFLSDPKLLESLQDDPRLQTAETRPSVDWLLAFGKLSPTEKRRQSESLTTKLMSLNTDPVSRIFYGAPAPAFTWQEVTDEKLAVLLDFSNLSGDARVQMNMLWMLRSFVEWLRRRGEGFHHQPISLVIDELTALVGSFGSNHDLLAADFHELITRLARSHKLWLSVALQELSQVPESIQRVLMQSGTLLFGATSDPQTALKLAARFERYDPFNIKKSVPRYITSRGVTEVIDETTVEYSPLEQQIMGSWRFLDLNRYEFLVGQGYGEGSLPTRLSLVSIANYDKGRFPHQHIVEEAKRQLTLRDGVDIEQTIIVINQRLSSLTKTEEKVESRIENEDTVMDESAGAFMNSLPAEPGKNPIKRRRTLS